MCTPQWLVLFVTSLSLTAPLSAAPASQPATQPGKKPATTVPASRPSSTAEEEAEIAEALARLEGAVPHTATSLAPTVGTGRTPTRSGGRGLSNLLNPSISANGLLLVGWSSRDDTEIAPATPQDVGNLETGFHVQEIELRVSSVVDHYFRADITIAADTSEIGVEEAMLTTLDLPWVTMRGGLIMAALGRHNRHHTHAYPFITAPLPWRELLGPEGLKDPGISAEILLPLPFYLEFIGQVFRGEWAPFQGELEDDATTPQDESQPDFRQERDFVYLGHLKALFELGDTATLEVGASYLGGRNGFGRWSNVAGANLSIKWKPLESERYLELDWTSEFLWVHRPGAPENVRRGGGYTSLRFQFARRWWVQARGAMLGLPKGDQPVRWRAEALAAFIPSEFSAFRLQYGIEQADKSNAIHEVFFQTIFSIGPHPPHSY